MSPFAISGLFAALVVAATTATAGPAASAPTQDDGSLKWEPWTTLDARRGLHDGTEGVVAEDGRIVLQWVHQRTDQLYAVVRDPGDATWPEPERLDGNVWLAHRLVTAADNQVVSISTDPYNSNTIGFHRLGASGWGPYESIPASTISFGGSVNAAGDVLIAWPDGYTLRGAVYSGGEWTDLPTLELDPIDRFFLHYRLFDDGRVVVVSSSRGDYLHEVDVIEVDTLADGVWSSEQFLRGDGEEFTRPRVATSPTGDVVVSWVQNAKGAPLGDLVAAVRPAGAAHFGEPKVLSERHQCRTRQRSPCAEAAILDSGKVVMTYRAVSVDGLEMVSLVRSYDIASGRWLKPQRLLPGRFARPGCDVIADPCDSFEVNVRADGHAVVFWHDEDRMYDCPTLATCHRVAASLEDIDRANLIPRPGVGAVAFRPSYRCGEESCRVEDIRASVLG